MATKKSKKTTKTTKTTKTVKISKNPQPAGWDLMEVQWRDIKNQQKRVCKEAVVLVKDANKVHKAQAKKGDVYMQFQLDVWDSSDLGDLYYDYLIKGFEYTIDYDRSSPVDAQKRATRLLNPLTNDEEFDLELKALKKKFGK